MLFSDFKARGSVSTSPMTAIDGGFACRYWDKRPSITSIIIFFLVRYGSIYFFMHMMFILCPAADAVRSGNWFTLFKVLKLNVTLWTVFLHLSNFGFGLSLGSVADFSNTRTRALISVEPALCLLTRRAIQFGLTIWIRVRIIFGRPFFLINKRRRYRWKQYFPNWSTRSWPLTCELSLPWTELWIHPPYVTTTLLLPMVSGNISLEKRFHLIFAKF